MNTNETTSVYGRQSSNSNVSEITQKNVKKRIGLNYPLQASPNNGYFSKYSGKELLKACIKQLIQTEPGERVMMPFYGCGLRKFIGEPMDEFLRQDIEDVVTTAFSKYLPLVDILKLEVSEVNDDSSIRVALSVKVKDEVDSIIDVNIEI